MPKRRRFIPLLFPALLAPLAALSDVMPRDGAFVRAGQIEAADLDETSGLEASGGQAGHWFAINDSKAAALFVFTDEGRHVQRIEISGAKNVDWEALAAMPDPHRPGTNLLVIGDIGDNDARRPTITLYIVEEPSPGGEDEYPSRASPRHVLNLRYPDGARDAESLAWDPQSDRLVIVTKRDRPARAYAIDRALALEVGETTLDYIGTLHPLRPPDDEDARRFGRQAPWVSQPTGMDISEDGLEVAIVTYRSLYRFDRPPDQDLAEALAAPPTETVGPPGATEEAVAYVPGARQVMIASEGRAATLYRSDETPGDPRQQHRPER